MRGGGGWGGDGRGDLRKNILKSDFEHKKVLQGNTYHTIALYVREKHSMITRGLAEKQFLRKPMKSPKLHVENPATV